MFEAGLFGTLEDLFLGAKGGVENFGRGVENALFNSSKGKSTSNSDLHNCEVTDEQYTACQKEFSDEITRKAKNDNNVLAGLTNIFNDEVDMTSIDYECVYVTKLLLRRVLGIKFIVNEISKAYNCWDENFIVQQIITSKIFEECACDELKKMYKSDQLAINNAPDMGNILGYMQCNPELAQVIYNMENGKISKQEAAKVISISIDTQKMIWNYLQKKQGVDIGNSTPKTDYSPKALLDKIKEQPEDIRKLFQDALAKAKTTALEEIKCFEEITAFAKKKSEGRLTQTDAEELERKLPVWKQCLLKAKSDVMDTFTTENTRADNSGEKKPEITLEAFEEALHYAKEQISSL